MTSTTKWMMGFLVMLLLFLQYRLWIQPQGVIDMVAMKKQLAVQEQENAQLKKRNELLLDQVGKLQNNKEAVESRARGELGMIKKGETFYQVVQ